MILVNCVWRQEELTKHIENVIIDNEQVFKLVKIKGMRMFFDSKIEDDIVGMQLIEKAIQGIKGYKALVINVVPVVGDNLFEGYKQTVCRTEGQRKKYLENHSNS